MQCVGMAISHNAKKQYPIFSYMARLAAKYQNKFGEYFTTLSIFPNEETHEISVEAYQVSDAAMRLDSEHYFEEDPSETEVKIKEPLKVGNQMKEKFDVNWLLCALRVKKTNSKFPLHSFPWPQQKPTIVDLQKHFENNLFCPSWYALFDFNLLTFLLHHEIVSPEEMEIIVKSIIASSEIPEKIMNKIVS